jgi:LacI family transcriptional regulator
VKASKQRSGIKAVAERAGVSISTVSRVFSGRAEVNPQTRQRVVASANELGYRPNMLAQSLRLGATHSAGFIADDLSNHLNTEIAAGAEGVLRARGYSLLVMNSEMDEAFDTENIHVLQARRVDALMMTPVTEDDAGLLATLAILDVPVVIVDGDLAAGPEASFVLSDHRTGASIALRHLVELGHRRIDVITGPTNVRSARQRAMAVDDVSADVKDKATIRHVTTELSHAGGRHATASGLADPSPCTAVFVGGDQLLTGVLEAMSAADLRLGHDVSLVASDPVALANVFQPPLAKVTRDALGLGRHAADILLRALDDPGRDTETELLPTVYEPRASVGTPRA